MVHLDQMSDLVRDHVIDERRREMDQPPAVADRTFGGAKTPLAFRIRQANRRCTAAEPRGVESGVSAASACARSQRRSRVTTLRPDTDVRVEMRSSRPSRCTPGFPATTASPSVSPNTGSRSPSKPRTGAARGTPSHSSRRATIQRSFSKRNASISRHAALSGALTKSPRASTVSAIVRLRRRAKRYSMRRPARIAARRTAAPRSGAPNRFSCSGTVRAADPRSRFPPAD